MTNTYKKFSTVVAALVIGVLSIYATSLTFNSTNQTAYQTTATLNMQSGGQIQVTMAPGQTVPTQINNDAVVGVTLYGAFVPAGSNAVVPSPNGGIQLMWQMAGSTAVGINCEPLPGGGTLS